jgi:hypothetical protein
VELRALRRTVDAVGEADELDAVEGELAVERERVGVVAREARDVLAVLAPLTARSSNTNPSVTATPSRAAQSRIRRSWSSVLVSLCLSEEKRA